MKKIFKVFLVTLALIAGSGNTWAQISFEGMDNPENWHYLQLTAKTSTTTGGYGEMSLALMMPNGFLADEKNSVFKEMAENDSEAFAQNMALIFPYGNPSRVPDDIADDVLDYTTIRGFSLLYMPGMEVPEFGISTYIYFYGKARAYDGSYFAGWSYTDGGTDLGKVDDGRTMENWVQEVEDHNQSTIWDNEAYAWVYPKAHIVEGQLFKLLAEPEQEFEELVIDGYPTGAYIPVFPERVVYATFYPVRPVAYSGNISEVEATAGATTQFEVRFDVDGEDIDQNDFVGPSLSDAGWDVLGYEYDAINKQYVVTVRYIAQAGIEAGQIYKTGLTLESLAGPALTAPLSVRAVAADRGEAMVQVDDNDAVSYATWAEALAAANDASGNITLTLSKNIATDVTLTKALTLDLNGYALTGDVTTSADVTLKYSKFGGEISGNVTVSNGTLSLDGGLLNNVTVANGATLVANGATISGLLTNNGTTTIKDGEIASVILSAGTLTMQNGLISNGLMVNGGVANLTRGIINGTVALTVAGGTTTIEKLMVLNGTTNAIKRTAGTVTINCGKLDAATPIIGDVTLKSAYFKSIDNVVVPAELTTWTLTAGTEYNQGYHYFIGSDDARSEAGVSVCKIGATGYASLEAALAYANNNKSEKVLIIMTNNYTLPAGYYTLPANATLVVPMSNDQETDYEYIPRVSDNSTTPLAYEKPYEFRRLTFANGVNMEVFGTIELSCVQRASDDSYAALPVGAYGHLVMEEGSHMTLQNGSTVRAWGFMTGKGETDARRGSTVREHFQMGDWKGGSTSFGMLSDDRKVFPVTHYFIQNVESPVKYHPGAVLSTTTCVSASMGISITAQANDIKIVGVTGIDQAMFLMDNEADAENTWVRKWYDGENDIQTYEVNSGAHIGSMVLKLGKLGTAPLEMNSASFNLPITCNMKIHLLSGYMDFTQNTMLLPGAEVEVDKESTVSVTYDEDNSAYTGSLYIYDADDWGNYVYCNFDPNDGTSAFKGSFPTVQVPYTAYHNGAPNVRNLTDLDAIPDAKINIHGTFNSTDGWILTSNGGANIFSTNEDAGTFIFGKNINEGHQEGVYQCYAPSIYLEDPTPFYPAKLKNNDSENPYAETAGGIAGTAYCYINNRWTLMTEDEDNPCVMKDNYDYYYIKPQNYVKITSNEEDDDHLYHASEGSHDYILMAGCQWWEVEKVGDNLYHCLHPQNDTYYYWDDENEMWAEKRFVITWMNWNGDTIKSYDANGDEIKYAVPYGTMAEYLGTNPTREENVDYTYDFTGWQPALGPVTGDVTYTATYEAKPRMYTIIFQQEGGKEIERQFLTRDEFPVCENEPTKVGHILKWQPALAAVTGDAVYTATWLEEKPATWNIKFVNYDGTPVGEADGYDVAAGTMPTAPATPVKPATDEFTYNFTGWKPALESATRDLTYTAQFEEVATKYTITFLDENGVDVIETKEYAYGATPICTKAPVNDGYELSWNPQIQTVTGNATYTAKWKANIVYEPEVGPWTIEWYNYDGNLLQQTVVANNTAASEVQASFTNTTALTKPATSEYTYEFESWTPAITAATANAAYTAVYREIPIIGPEPETIDVTFITADGYASFCWDKNWIAPAGVTVYKATSKEDDMIFIEEVNGVIPAEAGVILKGSAAQVTVTATEDEATSLAGNILKGTTVSTPNPAYNNASVTVYAMHCVGGTTVFDSYEGETIPANKAYIQLGAGAPARLRVVMAGNTTTGMENAAALNSGATKRLINGQLFILRDGKMYNVQGIKL